jgi:hypothetical protein
VVWLGHDRLLSVRPLSDNIGGGAARHKSREPADLAARYFTGGEGAPIMIGWLLRIVTGVVLAIALSQFPEFAQQYGQRIGGAVDALRPIVVQFDEVAARAGFSREAALERLRRNPDDLVVGQTTATAGAIERYERLAQLYTELVNAREFERLVVFAKGADTEIAARTLEDLRPAVPATVEGIVLATLGFILGYLVVAILGSILRRLLRMRRPVVYYR